MDECNTAAVFVFISAYALQAICVWKDRSSIVKVCSTSIEWF